MSYVVCLTFDFDALSPWVFRRTTDPVELSRGEFGLVGARRILALLGRHGIQTTWFVPVTRLTHFHTLAATSSTQVTRSRTTDTSTNRLPV